MKFMRVRFMRRNDVFFICNIYEFHMNFICGKIGCVDNIYIYKTKFQILSDSLFQSIAHLTTIDLIHCFAECWFFYTYFLTLNVVKYLSQWPSGLKRFVGKRGGCWCDSWRKHIFSFLIFCLFPVHHSSAKPMQMKSSLTIHLLCMLLYTIDTINRKGLCIYITAV